MDNFESYFLPERRIFLENISYETLQAERGGTPRRLGCRDTVVSQLIMPAGVKFIFNRRLSFEPEAHFTLSVSFGVFLRFDEARRDSVDWQQVNLVKEFTKSCPALLTELSSRTTLLVAQITSSAGGVPIVASPPPRPMGNEGADTGHSADRADGRDSGNAESTADGENGANT